jgi:hypothetical protein
MIQGISQQRQLEPHVFSKSQGPIGNTLLFRDHDRNQVSDGRGECIAQPMDSLSHER